MELANATKTNRKSGEAEGPAVPPPPKQMTIALIPES
jgi:hypothetical protein